MLLPSIQEDYEMGEKGFHIMAPRHLQEPPQRFEQRGIGVREADPSDQIESRPREDAHLREGHFDW